MDICHRGPTASEPKEPALSRELHAFLRSYLQLSMAVPTDGRQGSSTCERISGRPYMSNSVPWLFEVAYGHLPPRPTTASKPKEPALHAFLHLHTIAYSPPQSSRWPCQRRPKATYTQMTHSHGCLRSAMGTFRHGRRSSEMKSL